MNLVHKQPQLCYILSILPGQNRTILAIAHLTSRRCGICCDTVVVNNNNSIDFAFIRLWETYCDWKLYCLRAPSVISTLSFSRLAVISGVCTVHIYKSLSIRICMYVCINMSAVKKEGVYCEGHSSSIESAAQCFLDFWNAVECGATKPHKLRLSFIIENGHIELFVCIICILHDIIKKNLKATFLFHDQLRSPKIICMCISIYYFYYLATFLRFNRNWIKTKYRLAFQYVYIFIYLWEEEIHRHIPSYFFISNIKN